MPNMNVRTINNNTYKSIAHFDLITSLAFFKNIDEYEICLRFFIKNITKAIAIMNANIARGTFQPFALAKLVL